MKRSLSILLLFSLLLNACGKKESGCVPNPVTAERAQLIAYCSSKGITYEEHSSGLFYQVMSPGSGASPTTSSVVSVVYTGKTFDDKTFDATANPVSFSLSSVIDGWKIGIPLIKKGGRIKLIIPSALAYSCTGSLPDIQPNEPLFFDVTVSDVR